MLNTTLLYIPFFCIHTHTPQIANSHRLRADEKYVQLFPALGAKKKKIKIKNEGGKRKENQAPMNADLWREPDGQHWV